MMKMWTKVCCVITILTHREAFAETWRLGTIYEMPRASFLELKGLGSFAANYFALRKARIKFSGFEWAKLREPLFKRGPWTKVSRQLALPWSRTNGTFSKVPNFSAFWWDYSTFHVRYSVGLSSCFIVSLTKVSKQAENFAQREFHFVLLSYH